MRASGYARADADWYVEPAWVVDALFAVERFEGVIFDPACGGGRIPERAKAAGYEAVGSDIAHRDYGIRADFLRFERGNDAVNIVTNPPYSLTEQFVRHALSITTGKVAIITRLAFLESQRRRDGLFREHPPARVWVCSKRPSMPPGGTDVPAKGGSVAYAWFVWDRAHQGATTLGWLP